MDIETTTTADGVKLHGVCFVPEKPRTDLLIDGLIMMHGSSGNFYSSASTDRARHFCELGVPVAVFNTRGHDTIAGASQSGGHKIGNAFERLSESHLDIAAQLDWAEARGFKRIGLLGSSLGAVKVVLAQAKLQDPRVACVISVGPLRFSQRYYEACEMSALHMGYKAEAEALVKAGKGDAIMSVDFPNDGAHFSANVYLDRHCSEHYDICAAHTDQIRCPVLVITGSEEQHPRMRDVGRDMNALAAGKNPGYVWSHTQGGGHGLHEHNDVFFAEVMGFLGAR
jgi:pimeloyl-ACP methyl ester carboxylesterase